MDKITLELTPIELWILYHRVNQSHMTFWEHYSSGNAELQRSEKEGVKHNLWIKLSELAHDIDLVPMQPFEVFESKLNRVGGEVLKVHTNGDVKIGCKTITFQEIELTYQLAKKAREDM